MTGQLIRSLIFCLIASETAGIQQPSAFDSSGDVFGRALESTFNRPRSDVPRDLQEFWLRFHETEICQGVDAVFVFNPNGVEIFCVVEEEKSFQKLADMAASLRSHRRVDLYVTRLSSDNKSGEVPEPPPSLWNNPQLISYLHDPFFRSNSIDPALARRTPADSSQADQMLTRRVCIYADQILEWQRKLHRYASDIQLLAPYAWRKGAAADLQARAVAACRSHALGMSKLADRLEESLSHALPQVPKRPSTGNEYAHATPACSPLYCSLQLSLIGQRVARRVESFVFPRDYSVDISDLRDSTLIESLRFLRRRVSDVERPGRK